MVVGPAWFAADPLEDLADQPRRAAAPDAGDEDASRRLGPLGGSVEDVVRRGLHDLGVLVGVADTAHDDVGPVDPSGDVFGRRGVTLDRGYVGVAGMASFVTVWARARSVWPAASACWA